ncbi:serine/threonine protein kinase [Chelatococcus asaccharovorans]|uniref:Protein kinase-like protein n=1 Tax=Chelatococcus asaccharovorans TaxID=28210 RepID=A0A2V3TZX3_9HYPH|nr:serine/threonine-protein kinase [Chelatococcus asaccharovorans]MBS7704650.1 serine/threonine protein kinase [Chelatococcus asaccharovorans]PXW54551.1 protein kinase-like protein [Chelatococcus asaccharovorans]
MLRERSEGQFALLRSGQRLTAETSGVDIVVEQHIAGGGQGDVYAVSMGHQRYALKWYRSEFVRQDGRLRERLRRLSRRDPPSPRFLWPIDLVTSADHPNTFGYIMPFRDSRFRDFDGVIIGAVTPSWRVVVTAALETVQEYRALHSGGWCYMDINFGNVALDPSTGEVRICDNDNADVNDAPIDVALGTPQFMAPEIMRGQARPTIATDLWSLSVLLFYALFRCHPLLGAREYACPIMDAAAERRLYGTEPVFIFDPQDASNRPVDGYHREAIFYWPIYPSFMREMFVRAFTSGIADPRHGRVLETEWRTALVRLRDAIALCPYCGTENFFDADADEAGTCWAPACRRPMPRPVCLQVGDDLVVADERVSLYPHHVNPRRRFDFATAVGDCVRHPERPELIGLRNGTPSPLKIKLADGREREVAPNQIVELQRGMQIDFGSAKAEVV